MSLRAGMGDCYTLLATSLGAAVALLPPGAPERLGCGNHASSTVTFCEVTAKEQAGELNPALPCRSQAHQVLAALAKKPEYAELVVFEVDFDTQKDAVRSFNAQRQSTLIAFKGPQETRRLVAETAAEPIEDLLKSSLKK